MAPEGLTRVARRPFEVIHVEADHDDTGVTGLRDHVVEGGVVHDGGDERDSAASMLATCSWTERSVWTWIIRQVASILTQASSEPYCTACYTVFDAPEWTLNTISTGPCAQAPPDNPAISAVATAVDLDLSLIWLPPSSLGQMSDASEIRRVVVKARSRSGLRSSPSPGPGGTVIRPPFTSGKAVTRSRYHVR